MEDLEFKEAIIAKRHQELLDALEAIYRKLDSTNTSNQSKELKQVLQAIEQSLKQDSTPKQVIAPQITEELKKLSKTWVTALDKVSPPEPTNWGFTIYRDEKGFIQHIEAKRKP